MTHEFGHFAAALICKVKVLEFSIGMGPLLWQKQTSTTLYSLRLLPIGGFCSMLGEDEGEEAVQPGSINYIHPLKRVFVMASGALMNFISAILIFFVIMCFRGTDTTTTLEMVEKDGPAYTAGITEGDTIVRVGDNEITDWDELSKFLQVEQGEAIDITVLKANGETKVYSVVPALDSETNVYRIGVISKVKFVFWHALRNSVLAIGEYIVAIIQIFGGVFSGEYAMNEVFSGPIGVVPEIGRQMSLGLLPVLYIAGAIAVSLGFFNLLPFPALDGSRIVFALVEMIKGSPISRKWEGRIHYIGFIVLMLFAVYVAYNDIAKLL
jgi:regulator of sigma E protease